MTKIDIGIILIYSLCVLYGIFHGLIKTFLPLFVIVVLSIFYFKVSLPDIVLVLGKIPVQGTVLKIFLAILIFIIALYLIHKLSNFFEKFTIVKLLDKSIGGLCGFIIATFFVYGIAYITIFFLSPAITANSKLYPYIDKFFSIFIRYVK